MNKLLQQLYSCFVGHPQNNKSVSPSLTECPSATLMLQVLPCDLNMASRSGLQKPLLISLQRATGTSWRLYPNGLAIEVVPPHRACRLPDEVFWDCRDWSRLLTQGRQEHQVELLPTTEREGYSLIQRRSLAL